MVGLIVIGIPIFYMAMFLFLIVWFGGRHVKWSECLPLSCGIVFVVNAYLIATCPDWKWSPPIAFVLSTTLPVIPAVILSRKDNDEEDRVSPDRSASKRPRRKRRR